MCERERARESEREREREREGESEGVRVLNIRACVRSDADLTLEPFRAVTLISVTDLGGHVVALSIYIHIYMYIYI